MNRAALVTVTIGALLASCCPVAPGGAVSTLPDPTPVGPDPDPTPPPDPVAPAVTVDWAAAGIDWSKPPAGWEDTAFAPPTPVRFVLPSGLTVYLIENHRLPLVSVRMLHGAAGSRHDGARAGLAALTADLLDEGAGTRSATELPEELERLGASLAISAGTDGTVLALDSLAETLDPALALVADVVLRPRFSAADFARVKAERIADLELRVDSPRAIAALVFERVVFGPHSYANPGSGWVDTVKALTLADVKSFWKGGFGPGATTIIVTGDVTRAALEPTLAKLFGGWKRKLTPPPRPQPPAASKPVLAVVDMPGRPQTVVTIGRLGPDVGDPARAAHDVGNAALGGSFASRLNTRLREELGYTYGIFSTFYRGQWAGAWSTSSSIRTDVTGAAIREALAIIRATAAAPLPADELTKTKALLTRSLPQEFETNASIAAAFATVILEQRPLIYWRERIAALDAVTGPAAQAAAARLWTDLSIVVVGDWSAIGKDLEALGLPIVRYDVQGRPLR